MLQARIGLPQADEQARSRAVAFALCAALLAAAAVRLAGLFHDLPFSYYGDELHFVRRSLALGAGDLNPHWFNKPALLMYALLGVYGAFCLAGMAIGRFESVDAFGAYALQNVGPFVLMGRLVVFASALVAVWLLFKLGERVGRAWVAGFAAAGAGALLAPMVAGSQVIKADVPSGMFLLAAALVYLRARDDHSPWVLVFASALAGLSMATKYFGVVFLATLMFFEMIRPWTHGISIPRALARVALGFGVFTAVFFVASPYSFLDPTLGKFVWAMLSAYVEPGHVSYDPDSQTESVYGLSTLPAATWVFVRMLASTEAVGLPLLLLCAAGAAILLTRRETRWEAGVLLMPVAAFCFLCVTFWAYHSGPRHLNAVYPLMLACAFPGASALVGFLGVGGKARGGLAAGLVLLAALPSGVNAIQRNVEIMAVDTRTLALGWVRANVDRDSRILLDNYSVKLPPSAQALRRYEEVLASMPTAALPRGEQGDAFTSGVAFTAPQRKRFDLLRRYPPAEGYNVVELHHPWWSADELTNEQIRSNPEHRYMSDPLVNYEPPDPATLAEQGFDYVITSSLAQSRYATGEWDERFPSWIRFYDGLKALQPLAVFDPANGRAKGPVVYIYEVPASAEAKPDAQGDNPGS